MWRRYLDRTIVIVAAAAIVMAACATGSALAQADFPTRTIRIVVPTPPGPTLDTLPRLIAAQLAERWHVPVIVENRPGAAQNLGAETVANAEPDGYTLLAAPKGPLVISQYLYPKLGFDPPALVPVAIFATQPAVLVARQDAPFSTVAEMIAYAKANPGRINYGSPGTGSSLHLMLEMLSADAGIRLVHLPYKGLAPAEADLLAGHIDVMFDILGSALPYIKSGRFKAIGVTSRSPLPELPDIAPIAASYRDYVFAEWFAFMAPPKTPPAIASKLAQAVAETLKLPQVAQRLRDVSVTPVGNTPAETAVLLNAERERWRKIVAELGLKIE
jgi:tripartite-type tricarboxylate transporter receptor subunit TctC